MSGMHLSSEFFELIKAIGESKSKQEEDRIIAREVATLKKKLESGSSGGGSGGAGGGSGGPNLGYIAGSPMMLPGSVGGTNGNALNTNKKKAREFLVRILYVEMLGHDGSFGYIKAVVSVQGRHSPSLCVCKNCLHDDQCKLPRSVLSFPIEDKSLS
jgi:AP-4 complex subunit epsilon-1